MTAIKIDAVLHRELKMQAVCEGMLLQDLVRLLLSDSLKRRRKAEAREPRVSNSTAKAGGF
jgi:hypothetical protein